MDRRTKLVLIGLAISVVALVGFGGYLLLAGGRTPEIVKKANAADIVPIPNAAPPLKTGAYNYDLAPLPHKKGVIIDGGFPKGSTPDKKKAIVAQAAARDPFVLWYFLTRVYSGVKEVPSAKQLEDRNLRIEWHQKLLTLLDASNFTNVSLEGKTFFNEGVNSGGMVTASQTTFGNGMEGTEISMGGNTSMVKNNCVNKQVVSAPKAVIILPPSREEIPCPNKRNPKATQPVQDNNPRDVAPTPGYKRGNAEQVVGTQESEPKGGTEPTPKGTPGTGAGGTTPSGSDNGEVNSGPTNDPVPSEGAGQDRPAGEMPPPPD
jgi:hypothetical protein